MDVLDLLVEASYARDKAEILATANRKMEVLRWTVRMAKDRKLFTPAQFECSASPRSASSTISTRSRKA